ncbi:MAG: SHOCT domain-containing protein [Aliarcobacter sp.]|nr:SHOCT domain-containing protein [Aliarcobacter sp.]
MQKLTIEGQNIVNDLSNKYNLSQDAVIHMIGSVNNGGGSMAQFNCPELGGGGQWMRGGMTMVGDMFNYGLKNTVDNLCNDISNALATTIIFPIAPKGTTQSNQWWPVELGNPFSSGAQNSTRYAIFQNRLAVDINGNVTVYDTLDNNISGISQQQGGNDSLTFSSQYGTILVSTLPIVKGANQSNNTNQQNNFVAPIQNNFVEPIPEPISQPAINNTSNSVSNESSKTIIELIEQVASLHKAGILTDNEFNTKKAELLSRL